MINLPFQYGYIVLTIPFILVWILLFLIRKDTRKEQLRMSYIAAILGPFSEIIYFRDYWLPESIFPIFIGKFPLMVEDIIFGFSIGGISAIVYEILFRKKLSKFSKNSKHAVKSIYLALTFTIFLLISLKLGLNSIYASAIAFGITALVIIIIRHDLFINAVGSGFGVMLVMFVCYIFLYNFVANSEELLSKGWLLYNSRLDIRIVDIPLTEMIWGFTWGFLAGPWYEFVSNQKTVKI